MPSVKRYGYLAVVAAGATASLGPAWALDPRNFLTYSTGPVVLRSHLTVAEQYNDNLFYQGGAQVRDYITILRPSFEIWLGKPDAKNFLSLGYTLDDLMYLENDAQNSLDHTVDLKVDVEGARLTFSSRDQFQYLASIYGGYLAFSQTGLEYVPITLERFFYDLQGTLNYQISPKTSVYLTGNYEATDFQGRVSLMDISAPKGTAGFEYQAFPKTAFLGEVYYGETSTEPNLPLDRFNMSTWRSPSLTRVGGYLGVRGQFTPKVSGTVKAGYYASDFADGSAGPSGPGVEATVGWQIDSRTYASLSYSRKPSVQLQYARQASVLDWATLQVGRQFGATLKYSVGLRLSFGHNDYDARELTSAEGQMLGLPAGLQLYPAKADQYYRAGLDLAYRIRLWLKAALSYEYEARTSNGRGAIDYGVNRVTMSMVLGY